MYYYNSDIIKDSILIVGIKNEDEKSFTILFDRYYKKLVNTLVKRTNYGTRVEAEDIATDTFLIIRHNIIINKYEDQGTFFSYLYIIAERAFKRIYETNKTHTLIGQILNFLENEIYDHTQDKERYLAIAEQAISQLNFICQELIAAQYGVIKTPDKVIINEYPKVFTSISNVRNKRNKCMEKLRKIANELLKVSL